MTAEAQRIAIAEACGKRIDRPATGWHDLECDCRKCHPLPDYPNDLSAMHEAEKTLNPREQRDYAFELSGRFYPDGLRDAFDLAHATAAKRAEAFLRTLNLWTDET